MRVKFNYYEVSKDTNILVVSNNHEYMESIIENYDNVKELVNQGYTSYPLVPKKRPSDIALIFMPNEAHTGYMLEHNPSVYRDSDTSDKFYEYDTYKVFYKKKSFAEYYKEHSGLIDTADAINYVCYLEAPLPEDDQCKLEEKLSKLL